MVILVTRDSWTDAPFDKAQMRLKSSNMPRRIKTSSMRVFLCVFPLLAGGHMLADEVPSSQPAITQDAPDPRSVVDQTIANVIAVLEDQTLTLPQRASSLDAILKQQMDFATLSRLMLGKKWDELPGQSQADFIEELSRHLMGVYLPMTLAYSGQTVQVVQDIPEANGDHTVHVEISSNHKSAPRRIAMLSCRMRQTDRGWKAIDIQVQGMSVAAIFAAQFKPVLAKEGIDALLERLREKNSRDPLLQNRG